MVKNHNLARSLHDASIGTAVRMIEEKAELYGKTTVKRTIYCLAAARRIPAFKVGGTWRFARADIDSWIKQQSSVDQGGDVGA